MPQNLPQHQQQQSWTTTSFHSSTIDDSHYPHNQHNSNNNVIDNNNHYPLIQHNNNNSNNSNTDSASSSHWSTSHPVQDRTRGFGSKKKAKQQNGKPKAKPRAKANRNWKAHPIWPKENQRRGWGKVSVKQPEDSNQALSAEPKQIESYSRQFHTTATQATPQPNVAVREEGQPKSPKSDWTAGSKKHVQRKPQRRPDSSVTVYDNHKERALETAGKDEQPNKTQPEYVILSGTSDMEESSDEDSAVPEQDNGNHDEKETPRTSTLLSASGPPELSPITAKPRKPVQKSSTIVVIDVDAEANAEVQKGGKDQSHKSESSLMAPPVSMDTSPTAPSLPPATTDTDEPKPTQQVANGTSKTPPRRSSRRLAKQATALISSSSPNEDEEKEKAAVSPQPVVPVNKAVSSSSKSKEKDAIALKLRHKNAKVQLLRTRLAQANTRWVKAKSNPKLAHALKVYTDTGIRLDPETPKPFQRKAALSPTPAPLPPPSSPPTKHTLRQRRKPQTRADLQRDLLITNIAGPAHMVRFLPPTPKLDLDYSTEGENEDDDDNDDNDDDDYSCGGGGGGSEDDHDNGIGLKHPATKDGDLMHANTGDVHQGGKGSLTGTVPMVVTNAGDDHNHDQEYQGAENNNNNDNDNNNNKIPTTTDPDERAASETKLLHERKQAQEKIQRALLELKRRHRALVKKKLPTKEELMKRQEAVKQTRNAAYWKQLVVKQRNLLEAQERILTDNAASLRACREYQRQMNATIPQLQREADEYAARARHLTDMIAQHSKQVLAARKKRKDLEDTNRSKKRPATGG